MWKNSVLFFICRLSKWILTSSSHAVVLYSCSGNFQKFKLKIALSLSQNFKRWNVKEILLKSWTCRLWSHRKRLDKKAKNNFKIYDVTDWATNNYNTHFSQYLRSKGNQRMKFGQLIEYNLRMFSWKIIHIWWRS